MTDADLERLLVLDGAPGPALTIEAFDADAIIDAALAAAGFGPAGGTPRGGRGGGGGGGGGGDVAAGAKGGLAVGTKLAILGGLIAVAVAIALLVGRPHHGQPQVAPPADAAVDAPPDAAIATGPAIDAAVEATPLETPTIEMPSDKVGHSEHDTKAAADLLGEANAKRAEKKWRESDDLYAKVIARAPKTLAAQTALVASGSLHLEHFGDPKGAAQRFKKALAIAKGPLAEDARWGLAEAARASHDAAAEAAALDDFIKHHPDSPLISQAKTRRAELK